MYDVVALGELLIDFTESGKSEQGNLLLEVNPGGAPCNVLAMLKHLGKEVAFIGKVGQDIFGTLLKNTLNEVGIASENLVIDKEVRTTLAFVHTLQDGDREFSFYRNPGADMMLREEEVNLDIIKSAKIFHFGTLSMTHEGIREVTKKAIACAKEGGALISFDPNLREPLWDSLELAKEQMEYGFQKCDILKISDNEIQFVTGEDDYEKGIAILQQKYQIPLILLTMGKEGSRAYYRGMCAEKEGFAVNAIETTGAGDTFCGCALGYLLEHDFKHLSQEELEEILTFANAGAALITLKKGAIRSMPTKQEIYELVKSEN